MVIYLDTLLLENFIVNYFLLYITSQTIRIKVKTWKLALAAIIGAAYVLTKIYPSLIIFTSLLFKVLIAGVMVLIVFNQLNVLFNLKALLIYMLYSMLLAGLCFFIVFNQTNYMGDFSVFYDFEYKKLMLAIIIFYLTINRLVIFIKDRKELSTLIYTVDIVSNNIEKKVLAFLDTGNELREPATNLPVMIIEKSYFQDIDINEKNAFYIPYRVVDGSVGKLIGFKPEYIKIHYGNEIKQKEVIVALCENNLSSLNEYQALLSRGII
ncbi:sigma-E processing peptidase SpoIIGA [Clostridium swellfunianum]|uniref:sigma-E processing peptidase SpoIIGA n=1 Tax=Clostridium swellfunianum TaxID=1367462 RepID=UPI00202FCAF9|nr:sigma-E processing peptidase SpoIIGA [Clostridium swellfunianum]MCM0648752.1 sigma-E processing peptidase SpoIIGA [Clostridium swellfunianum]